MKIGFLQGVTGLYRVNAHSLLNGIKWGPKERGREGMEKQRQRETKNTHIFTHTHLHQLIVSSDKSPGVGSMPFYLCDGIIKVCLP